MMRKFLLLTCLLFAGWCGWAQDVPLFTQKLTNSFLYNPSVAGNSIGSLTLSHRQLWSGVQDAPKTNFFSVHTPFGKYRYGVGVNFYQDNIGVSQNLYGSAAFAYHIQLRDEKMFSLGVSAEYNNQKLNASKFDAVDVDDEVLLRSGAVNNVDFSFGMSYKAKYYRLGVSANRLRALTGSKDSVTQFPSFYSGFLQFTLPVANGRDMIEPMVTYRGLPSGLNQIDAGVFYTLKNTFTLGGSYRSGGVINMTAGVRIYKYVLVGYSRDVYTGDLSKGIGATNEITLRFDFRDQSFYKNTRNARVINTRALATRRKTLSTYKFKGSPYQQSQRYKKSVKRNAYRSPNYRIESSKKLETMRRKPKPMHKRKRR